MQDSLEMNHAGDTSRDTLLVDDQYGLPTRIDPSNTRSDSERAEWLLGAIERHAVAETEALEQYEELAKVER